MRHARALLLALTWLVSSACSDTSSGVSSQQDALDLSDDLQTMADEAEQVGETKPSADPTAQAAGSLLSIIPDQCCIIGFRNGSTNCGDFEAVVVGGIANTICKRAANEQGATSYHRVSGHCRDRRECPQYRPPPPPPPPGTCGANERCCEMGANGRCELCFPRAQICP